jgi:DNA-binding protein H-NS
MDLNNLSLSELKKLHSDVAKAITGYEDRKKKEALAELETKAKEMGFSLAELLGTAAPDARKRSPAAVKFAHPENSSLAWTGRGRKPKWVVEALAAGKTLSDLAI